MIIHSSHFEGAWRKLFVAALIFSASLLAFSCGIFQTAPSSPPTIASPSLPPDPETRHITGQRPELDTFLARGIQPQVEALPERTRGRSYNIVLLLPFLSDQWEGSGSGFEGVAKWSLHFLGGAKMALETLDTEGPELSVTVLDTEASEQELGRLLKTHPALSDAHLIIGPYRRSNIQLVAEFVKHRDIIQVSPYSAAFGMTSRNPHYIQVRPSLETHCAALLRHALASYRPEQITLISGKGGINERTMAIMQEAYATWAGSRTVPALSEEVIDGLSSPGRLMPLLSQRDTAVFLVSAWQASDERFVYSLLRNLDLSRRAGQHIVVYGTPVWADFEQVDPDYFEKFKVTISNYSYIDKDNPDIAAFRRSYYDRYGAIPPEEAFLGYDVMAYFAPRLRVYGTGLTQHLEGGEDWQLHTRFAFERVVAAGTAEADPPIEQFENKFVHILRFSNYRFQPANNR